MLSIMLMMVNDFGRDVNEALHDETETRSRRPCHETRQDRDVQETRLETSKTKMFTSQDRDIDRDVHIRISIYL